MTWWTETLREVDLIVRILEASLMILLLESPFRLQVNWPANGICKPLTPNAMEQSPVVRRSYWPSAVLIKGQFCFGSGQSPHLFLRCLNSSLAKTLMYTKINLVKKEKFARPSIPYDHLHVFIVWSQLPYRTWSYQDYLNLPPCRAVVCLSVGNSRLPCLTAMTPPPCSDIFNDCAELLHQRAQSTRAWLFCVPVSLSFLHSVTDPVNSIHGTMQDSA